MGIWNKSGTINPACKPCDKPPGHYCAYCMMVYGCGNKIGDGSHNPLPGAVVTWTKNGVRYGSCTTDSTGQCCVRFLGPTGAAAGDGLLDLTVTHPGYADYTATVSCNDPANPGLAPVVVYMTTLKTLVTFKYTNLQDNMPVGCGTVTYPGGSCTTGDDGTCQAYVDFTTIQSVTAECPPFVPLSTFNMRGLTPPYPCNLTTGLPGPGCSPGYQSDTGVWADQSGTGHFCINENLIATIAGQSVPLTYGPRGWTGCGSLPSMLSMDMKPNNLPCAGGTATTNRAMPFFVAYGSGGLQITAPLCGNQTGLGAPIVTLVQSYWYCGDTTPPGGLFPFACDPAQGLIISGNPPGTCGAGWTIGGQTITFSAQIRLPFPNDYPNTGAVYCGPFSGSGTIAAQVPGMPAYVANPFAGPVTVTEAGGRSAGGPGGPSGGRDGGATPRTGPSLARKALNLAQAVTTHVSHGMPKADPATAAARLALCEGCTGPGGYWNPARRTCARPECGCNMDIKVTWADMSCPVGRWPAVASVPAAG